MNFLNFASRLKSSIRSPVPYCWNHETWVISTSAFPHFQEKITRQQTVTPASCYHTCCLPCRRISVTLFNSALPNILFVPQHHLNTDTKEEPKIEAEKSNEPEKKLSLFKRFKEMYKQYWYVLVPVHIFTSIIWFGSFYYLAKTGIDIVPLLESLGLPEKIIAPLRDSAAGHIAVMFALYKLATPARYVVTLGGTTISIKYLKEWGYIKPIPSKQKLKEMYAVKKENLKGRYQERKEGLKEAYRERRDGIKESIKGRKDT